MSEPKEPPRGADPAGREAPRDPIVSLTPHSPSFVDEKLREHRSDLLVTLGTASGRELVVNSLTQPALPEAFREASFRYLIAGREDNVESIFATLQEQEYTEMGAPMISFIEKKHREGIAEGKADTLTRLLERKFGLDSTDLQWVRQVTDIPNLQAALRGALELSGSLRLTALSYTCCSRCFTSGTLVLIWRCICRPRTVELTWCSTTHCSGPLRNLLSGAGAPFHMSPETWW